MVLAVPAAGADPIELSGRVLDRHGGGLEQARVELQVLHPVHAEIVLELEL